MKNLTFSTVILMVALIAHAVVIDGYDFDAPGTLERLSKMTRAEVDALSPDVRREYFKRTSELHSGGIVEKPGAGRGTLLFVDSTESLADGMFARDFGILDRTLKVHPKIVKGLPVTVEAASTRLKELNANAAVFVVTNSALPRLLTASEEGWAIVNVAKLKEGEPSKEALEKRIAVEVIRGLAQIFGSGNSGMSMIAITSLNDIDELQHPGFPATALKLCRPQMKKLGFEPRVTATYRVACKQGWAPPPITEAQRIIWKQVHRIPDKPITIEYDPKRDK